MRLVVLFDQTLYSSAVTPHEDGAVRLSLALRLAGGTGSMKAQGSLGEQKGGPGDRVRKEDMVWEAAQVGRAGLRMRLRDDTLEP